MTFSDEQRQRIIEESKGKVVSEMEWDDEGGYWVMSFEDGSELCFCMMAEL